MKKKIKKRIKKRRVYEIRFDTWSKCWVLTLRGAGGRRVDWHEKKSELVKSARITAKAHMPSQLVVCDKQGEFSYENTYQDDPRKSPG